MWFWPLIYKILNERHFWPSRGRQIKEKIEKYKDSKVWICGKGSVPLWVKGCLLFDQLPIAKLNHWARGGGGFKESSFISIKP